MKKLLNLTGKLQTGEIQEKKLTLCGMLFSGIFLWHLFFASVFHLRVYYFISTFENLLLSIYGSNEEIGNILRNFTLNLNFLQKLRAVCHYLSNPALGKRLRKASVFSDNIL